jgi:SAM-dependent methyltransferase
VATDSNLASLKRLAAEGRHRGLSNLLVVCCDATKPPFVKNHFDAVLCFEVLYYLVLTLGRASALNLPISLLKPGGLLVLSEMSRYGRALVDLVAMDVNNFRSLVETGTRWEKSDEGQLEVFQWSLAELKDDCRQAGLQVVGESGVSPIAGLFDFAWKFTSYPLRPVRDQRLQQIIEELDDQTSEACNLARNILLALKKA